MRKNTYTGYQKFLINKIMEMLMDETLANNSQLESICSFICGIYDEETKKDRVSAHE